MKDPDTLVLAHRGSVWEADAKTRGSRVLTYEEIVEKARAGRGITEVAEGRLHVLTPLCEGNVLPNKSELALLRTTLGLLANIAEITIVLIPANGEYASIRCTGRYRSKLACAYCCLDQWNLLFGFDPNFGQSVGAVSTPAIQAECSESSEALQRYLTRSHSPLGFTWPTGTCKSTTDPRVVPLARHPGALSARLLAVQTGEGFFLLAQAKDVRSDVFTDLAAIAREAQARCRDKNSPGMPEDGVLLLRAEQAAKILNIGRSTFL
jgi:hypothetical protein